MIAKALAAKHPEERSFKKLARYITDTSKGELLVARNVASPQTAAIEMEATAALSHRTRQPVYHFTISWRPDEAVSEAQMQEALDKALAVLGFEEHQVVASLHANTDHPHLHALVNRVHPGTHKAQSVWRDWVKLDRVVEEMGIAYGWQIATATRTFDPTLGRSAMLGPAWAKPTFSSWLNAQLRFSVSQLLTQQDASWEAFHELVGTVGASYQRGPRGAVFVDAGRPETMAGASRVMRICSLPTLERVLGPYQPPQSTPNVTRAFSRQTFEAPSEDLRERYKDEVDAQRDRQRVERAKRIREIKEREREERSAARAAFNAAKERAKTIDPAKRDALIGSARFALSVAYSAAKERARHAREALPRVEAPPTFTAWLYQQIRADDERAIQFVATHRARRRELTLSLPELGHPELHRRVIEATTPATPDPQILELYQTRGMTNT